MTCTVDGCTKPATRLRGKWCEMHYCRNRRGTPMHAPEQRRYQGAACAVADCTKPAMANALCVMHYTRQVRHGDTTIVHPRGCPPGPTNPSWKGDAVGYSGIHMRLRKERGPARTHPCAHCHRTARHWAVDRDNATHLRIGPEGCPYSTDPADYMPLCVSCHKLYDLERIAA